MSTVASHDGTVIDYERYGAGRTVVLIGGASQHRAIDERTTEIAQRLAGEGFAVVDYDRRGRGRSGDTPPWTLDKEVQDLAALVEAVGAPAALYTSSSGAAVALAAAQAGIGVAALALFEPPFFPGVDQSEYLAQLTSLLSQGQQEEAMRYFMRHVIGLPAEAVEATAQWPLWPALVKVAPTLVYDVSSIHQINMSTDWRRRWAGITVPTVVYSGDRTFPGLPEAADAVAAALPSADRYVLAGQDHGPTVEALVPPLAGFLRSAFAQGAGATRSGAPAR
jgi:pimeloyl-ACP methyl ester carboxylesterase